MRDLLETTCRVEAGSNLVSNRLIVNKSVGVRRVDGLFIKAFGIDQAPFYSRNFATHERGAVFKILRAMLCP